MVKQLVVDALIGAAIGAAIVLRHGNQQSCPNYRIPQYRRQATPLLLKEGRLAKRVGVVL
jgi:hypothetical protein